MFIYINIYIIYIYIYIYINFQSIILGFQFKVSTHINTSIKFQVLNEEMNYNKFYESHQVYLHMHVQRSNCGDNK